MSRRRSPGSVNLRLRDVLLIAIFAPVCSAALQQHANKAHLNAYDAQRHLSKDLSHAASSAIADSQYDIGADSLRARQRAYRDTSPIHHNNDKKVRTPTNERALATALPAAAGAPPALRSSVTSDALTPRHSARDLEDWKVEEIILLATVDGSLHARDRNNFAPRWQIGSESPMVETTYYRRNKSVDEVSGQELEDPLWIVEPSQDGSIYVYAPSSGFGMQKLGYTVKQLAELAPYASDGHPAVAYTAEKKTTLYTVDAATGNILKAFSSTGVITNNDRSCRTINPLVAGDAEEECERIGTITLGRTEYTIGIQDRNTGEPISTIRYAEWSPNTRDQDLRNKYTQTVDNNYVYTRHDGTVFRLSAKKTSNRANLHHKFSSPVAQVFDVFRADQDNSIDPTLIVLPQPAAPALSDMAFIEDDQNVFINCTEAGSWYALSEVHYPDITHEAPTAKCYHELHLPSLPLSKRERKLFTGVHPISQPPSGRTIDGRTRFPEIDPPSAPPVDVLPIPPPQTDTATLTWQNVLILLLTALISFGALYGYRDGRFRLPQAQIAQAQVAVPPVDAALTEVDSKPMLRENEPATETIFAHTRAASGDQEGHDGQADEEEDITRADANAAEDNIDPVKKKKATRGKRGGRKQKEKETAAAEARAQRLGLQIKAPIEVISVAASESPQVSGPLQINSLIIHTDKVIGQGSCGTCVFEGAFEGRGVAVKRMLSQYYELASQEVSFLQQSDDHENVIRYYCQQKDDHFLYIAVELCQASIFEVWEAEKAKTQERQLQLRKLKHEIQKDIPRTLQQLAKGLHHLHKLRIIHRDIKPQNILVAFPKKFVDSGPRLVISDFGLGKNLPENVSTLIDPTGNAGTSGWKAPELISQPQAESRHSQSTSHNDSATTGLPSGVKRAADIFSLGCLFFWMLTDGVHPYEDDNGWTQLRELNIKRDLKKMEVLERWSDAYEPMQLITSMLEHEPENRPTALQVLNHPFFWPVEKRLAFLCDVSDHFEREPRGVWEDGWTGDSMHLRMLETHSREVIGNGNNFLAKLDRIFVDTLGKQRKYSGDRLLDLLRALRNKKNHYEDMSDEVKKRVGPLAGGYLTYWTDKFPRLLMACYGAVHECGVEGSDRFKGYFERTS